MDDTANSSSDPTPTFQDLNIPSVTNQPIQTVFGKCQRFQDLTVLEKIYFFGMLVSISTAIGFTIYRMSTLERNQPDFTFCILLLVNAVFCICFTIDSIFRERHSEIIVLITTTIMVIIYLIVNYAKGIQNEIKLARLIVACISCVFCVIMGALIAKMYFVSNHLIFRTVGALQDMQILYRNLLYFQDVLKFDLQLGVSAVVLVLDNDEKIQTEEKVILGVGICFQVIYSILGWVAFEREIKWAVYIFWPLSSLEIIYISWKIYDVTTYTKKFDGLAGATLACIIFALIIHIALIVGSCFVFKGFNKGLKKKIFRNTDLEQSKAMSTL